MTHKSVEKTMNCNKKKLVVLTNSDISIPLKRLHNMLFIIHISLTMNNVSALNTNTKLYTFASTEIYVDF
jgi:hypothetical protein